MTVTVHDLMTADPFTLHPQQTLEHVRQLLAERSHQFAPVTDDDGALVGVLSLSDLLADHAPDTLVERVMTTKVYSVPEYSAPHLPARIMRNHKIHHVVITHEQRVTGVLSSFDLLQLVEDHKFVAKNPSTPNKHKKGKRQQQEA